MAAPVAAAPPSGRGRARPAGEVDPRSVALAVSQEEMLRDPIGRRALRTLGRAILLVVVLAAACALAWKLGFERAEKNAHERLMQRQIEEQAKTKPQTPRPPATLAADALAALERALKAEQVGDAVAADAALAEVQTLSPTTPGVLFRRAKFAVRRRDYQAAEGFLAEAAQRGERLGEARNLRALLAATQGQPELAETMFREAADADPFDGRTFYCWGETLRKNGQLLRAVEKLDGALRRDFDRADRGLYELKLAFARLELAPEGEYAREVNAETGKSDLPAPRLAVGAAARLLGGDNAGGAALLARLRPAAPPWLWREILVDPLIRRFGADPAVAAELRPQ